MLTSVNPSSVLLLLYILKYPHVKFQNKAVLCDGSCMSEQTSHFTNIFKMPLFWTIHGRFFLCLNVCKLSHHTIFSLGLHFFRMPWYIVATLYVCVCANTHLDVQTWCQTVVCVCVCVGGWNIVRCWERCLLSVTVHSQSSEWELLTSFDIVEYILIFFLKYQPTCQNERCVFTGINMFWDMMLCSPVEIYRRWRQYVHLKCL